LAAKDRATKRIKSLHPDMEDGEIKAKLVAYTSGDLNAERGHAMGPTVTGSRFVTDQSNSSVEKAGLLGSMRMRLLKSNDGGQLTGPTLAKAMAEDVAKGLIPCYVVATLGTTGVCAFDLLEQLGPVCNENDVWLHVDAAYAGTYAPVYFVDGPGG